MVARDGWRDWLWNDFEVPWLLWITLIFFAGIMGYAIWSIATAPKVCG